MTDDEVPTEECKGCGLAHGTPNSAYCSEICERQNPVQKAFRTGWCLVKQNPQERLTLCDECSNAVYDAQHQLGLDPWEDHDFESIAATVGDMLPDHLCENREEAEEWALRGIKCLCACNR